jgi:multimeric flavodoxin WrbA
MKILAINSSAKKERGLNQLIIDTLFEGAISKGAECESIRLSKYKISRCIACDYCQKEKDYTCIYKDKDDFENVVSKIKNADIILYSTPIYIFQMSSLMKIFLERYYGHGKSNIKEISKGKLLFHDIDNDLCRKPFVSIIVSDNTENDTTENVKNYFKTFSKFMGAEQVGTIIRNGARIFESEKMKNKKESILNSIYKAGVELAEKGIIDKKTEAYINRSLLPIPKIILNILKQSERTRKKLIERIQNFA